MRGENVLQRQRKEYRQVQRPVAGTVEFTSVSMVKLICSSYAVINVLIFPILLHSVLFELELVFLFFLKFHHELDLC